jgi:putative oxidoreductase
MAAPPQTADRLIFPSLARFYLVWSDIGYLLIRFVTGAILFVHGWGKIHTGIAGVSASMAKNGLAPSVFFGGSAIFLETVGAVCLAFGLFTRFFAAALAIEMAVALVAVHLTKRLRCQPGRF